MSAMYVSFLADLTLPHSVRLTRSSGSTFTSHQRSVWTRQKKKKQEFLSKIWP